MYYSVATKARANHMETPIYTLPLEIITDILLRLPTKSVQLCRCVCKAFNFLTKTPDFKTMHTHRANIASTNHHCSVYYRTITNVLDKEGRGRYYHTLDQIVLLKDDDDKSGFLVKHMCNPVPNNYTIIGCSNGLFCIEAETNLEITLLLWNPVTKQTRYIPKPKRKLIRYLSEIVFGFVPEINDYKLVLISTSNSKIQVYRMSCDSWSRVKQSSITFSDSLPKNVAFQTYRQAQPASDCWWSNSCVTLSDQIIYGVDTYQTCYSTTQFLNGAFHWIAEIPLSHTNNYLADKEYCKAIVSFNLRDEKLRIVDVLCSDIVPDPDPEGHCIRLGVLNESLCIIGRGGVVWLMNEYGIRESWTKQFFLPTDDMHRCFPIGCWKDYVLLRDRNGEWSFMMYNPRTRERKNFQIIRDHDIDSVMYFDFVETLLTLE